MMQQKNPGDIGLFVFILMATGQMHHIHTGRDICVYTQKQALVASSNVDQFIKDEI